jgi:glycosyltransferase involved in cell wall biosynthesis
MNNNSAIVCLPVFNEEKAILKMIREIKKNGFSIFISDGGSTDQSLSIAKTEKILVLDRTGRPKGYGMMEAINYAKKNGKELIVFIDCDLTYPCDKIPDLVRLIQKENLDMVVGNRNRKVMSLKSKILNATLVKIVNVLFKGNLKDPASGFRVLRVQSFYNKLKETGMDLEIELSGYALLKNLKVKEVAVDYYTRVGESKLRFLDIIKCLFTIFSVRFRKYP